MKKIRRRYDRDFKISVLAELESGKTLAQVAREYGIHPSLPCRWKTELSENPEKAFRGNGNKYKDQARIAELERLLGQAHAEIELLKKDGNYISTDLNAVILPDGTIYGSCRDITERKQAEEEIKRNESSGCIRFYAT